MRPADNIEKLVSELRVKPRAEVSKKNLEDALTAQKKATGSAYSKPTVWGIIMKSQITKIAAAAAIIVLVVIGVTVINKSTTPAYGITDLSALLNEARTLHVKSTIYIYETDSNQPEFEKAIVIPHDLWLDVPNMREHFIGHMSMSAQDGRKFINLIEGVRDAEYAMDIDHTKKTVQFNKVSLVERRLADKDKIQRYLNRVTEEELEHFVCVGQEIIDGIHYDIWERESEHIHDKQSYKRVRCWMSPSTGDIGKIYIWNKNNESDWRLSWSVEKIERDIEIPDSVFAFEAPEEYRYLNTLETAYESNPAEAHIYIGNVRYGMPINFTLDDGSVIVSWMCDKNHLNGIQEQELLFKDLVPGGDLPKLPMVIYRLKTIPRETYSHPAIYFTGRHLAYTKKENNYFEWAIFVPEKTLPDSKEGRGYRIICEFNLENEQPSQEGNPISENRIDADEFDLFVREAMAERSDNGLVPDYITYENVIELARQIREEINQ